MGVKTKVTIMSVAVFALIIAGVFNWLDDSVQLEWVDDHLTVNRLESGLLRIECQLHDDYCWKAVGYAHARDRYVQMCSARLAGKGHLSEGLASIDELLAADVLLKRTRFYEDAKEAVNHIDDETLASLQAYADGVNHYFETNPRPLEFITVDYTPEPWVIEDSLVIGLLTGYIGLAESQAAIEKANIEIIHTGNETQIEFVKNLFSPEYNELDTELIELIKKTKIFNRRFPKDSLKFVPDFHASNNWAVSGEKSVSGNTIYCSDPHLEVNRLPSVWYETVMKLSSGNVVTGVGIPGYPFPAIVTTNHISFGVTYGFMDQIDYFIEEIKDGSYKDGDKFTPLKKSTHTINRKGKDPKVMTMYQTVNGVVEVEDDFSVEPIKDGYYLSMEYSGLGALPVTVRAMKDSIYAKTVEEAQNMLSDVAISLNYIIADKHGNIGYQQSGSSPARDGSRILPIKGWDVNARWSGRESKDVLVSILNPESGYLVTANNMIGKGLINVHMGFYRKERIEHLLQSKEKLSSEDMKSIQMDVYSERAVSYLEILKPLISEDNSKLANLIRNWDNKYDLDSQGAYAYFTYLIELVSQIFEPFYGKTAWDFCVDDQCYNEFHYYYDKLIFEENELIFKEKTRSDYFLDAFEAVKAKFETDDIPRWGDIRKTSMNNILFAGQLPDFLGFDQAIELAGYVDTVNQGQLFHDRKVTFSPSYRLIADMGNDYVETVIPGGASGRVFSRFYKSEIDNWLNGNFKKVQLK
eukprot:TRINITY_DN3203_c0_g1_i1.p1 TRINITY_DN3203_c0_g1~~TRINITY_DN3203_c0_g1_i1.p1  ORF type:complete len:751 (-),score=155.76 TRINITY_DN3203_c0_g1_i1:44-2296(-)